MILGGNGRCKQHFKNHGITTKRKEKVTGTRCVDYFDKHSLKYRQLLGKETGSSCKNNGIAIVGNSTVSGAAATAGIAGLNTSPALSAASHPPRFKSAFSAGNSGMGGAPPSGTQQNSMLFGSGGGSGGGGSAVPPRNSFDTFENSITAEAAAVTNAASVPSFNQSTAAGNSGAGGAVSSSGFDNIDNDFAAPAPTSLSAPSFQTTSSQQQMNAPAFNASKSTLNQDTSGSSGHFSSSIGILNLMILSFCFSNYNS